MAEKPIRVGAIGFGLRCFNVFTLVHRMSPNVILTAVCDPHPLSRQIAKILNEDVKVYEDYQELCKDPEVDWVFIGSWNNQHKSHVISALTNNKHVFCEKPLATTVEDCVAMKKAWLATNGKCQFILGFVLRFTYFYQKIRDIIQSGKIGKVISMEFNETLKPSHGGFIMGDWRRKVEYSGGHLLEKTCHDFDLVNWILNTKAKRVASFGGLDFYTPENEDRLTEANGYASWPGLVKVNPFGADKDIIDNQVVIIEYENGVRSTFHTNCNSAIHERRMYYNGSLGCLRADLISNRIELRLVGEKEIKELHEDITISEKDWELNNKFIESFVGKLGKSGHGIPPEMVTKLTEDVSEQHGGGDFMIAKTIIDAMLNGTNPQCGINEGLLAAVTCLSADQAMKENKVVDLTPIWASVEEELNRK